jgi:hypothetical protein
VKAIVDGVVYLDVPASAWERLDRWRGRDVRLAGRLHRDDGGQLTAETYIVRLEYIDRLEEASGIFRVYELRSPSFGICRLPFYRWRE